MFSDSVNIFSPKVLHCHVTIWNFSSNTKRSAFHSNSVKCKRMSYNCTSVSMLVYHAQIPLGQGLNRLWRSSFSVLEKAEELRDQILMLPASKVTSKMCKSSQNYRISWQKWSVATHLLERKYTQVAAWYNLAEVRMLMVPMPRLELKSFNFIMASPVSKEIVPGSTQTKKEVRQDCLPKVTRVNWVEKRWTSPLESKWSCWLLRFSIMMEFKGTTVFQRSSW